MQQRTYEVMFIVRPDLQEEEIDKLLSNLESQAANAGATVKNVERMGKLLRAVDGRGRWQGDPRDRAPSARIRTGDQVHQRAHRRRTEAPGQDQAASRHAREAFDR